MPVPKGVASTVFGGTSELDKKIEASTAAWGGDSFEKQAVGMNAEEIESVKEISLNHYLFLKEKFARDPESMTADEIVAGELYQKLANGEQLSLNETAKLYSVLGKLELDVSDPTLQAAMKIKDKDVYALKLKDVRQGIFVGLTGINPDTTYDEKKKGVLERELAAAGVTGVKATWERVKFTVGKGMADKVYESHWNDVFEANKPAFKPEQQLAACAFIGSRNEMASWLDSDPTYAAAIGGLAPADRDPILKAIREAKDLTEFEKAVADLETKLGAPAGTLIDTANERGEYYDRFNPKKKAYELGIEGVFAADMDKFARKAIERQIGGDVVTIKANIANLEKARKEAENLWRAANAADKPAAKVRLDELSNRLQIARELEQAAMGKGAMKVLEVDQEYADLASHIPGAMKDDFMEQMIDDLGLRAGLPGGATAVQKETAINAKLKTMKKERFSIASILFGFLAKKA